MRILFHMLPELGHVTPTFPIARALAERGHEVIYTAALDLRGAIEARGFRTVALHRDVLARGRIAEVLALPTDDERQRAWLQLIARIDAEYLDGRIEALVRAIAPAVIAADVIALSPMQYVAHWLGIPCVQLSTSLPAILDGAAARWEASLLRLAPAGIPARAASLVARFGYVAERIDYDSRRLSAITGCPALVIAPAALEPAGAVRAEHLAVPIERERAEVVPPALAAFARGDAPLIYASLGSQAARYREAPRFIRAVVDALRAAPGLRAVLATGAARDPSLAAAPPNLLVLETAPQLWLLGRAAAFVTHAGLGGLREALAHGVPVIAVPQGYDQPANAARAVDHGLGVAIPAEAITGAALGAALDRVLDPAAGFRTRAIALDEACRREEARADLAAPFERAATRPPTRATRMPGFGAGAEAREAPPAREAVPGCELGAVPAAPRDGAPRAVDGWIFAGRAGHAALRPGARLDARGGPIEVGGAGFTLCPALAPALARARGALLVRATAEGELATDGPHVAGRTLRCRWRLDASEALFAHARWCADQALAAERAREPEIAGAIAARIRSHHELRVAGASPIVLERSARALAAIVEPHPLRGTFAAAAAVAPAAHEAARDAHALALDHLAREAAAEAAGTVERAARYARERARLAHRFAADLARRIDEHVRAAGGAMP